jgi:hypothetical protein
MAASIDIPDSALVIEIAIALSGRNLNNMRPIA